MMTVNFSGHARIALACTFGVGALALPAAPSFAADTIGILGAGISFESSEYKDGSATRRPFLYLEYKSLFLHGQEAGFQFYENNAFTASLSAELNDDGYDSADAGPLRGLPELQGRTYVNLGLRHAGDSGPELRFKIGADASRKSKGSKLDASIGWPLRPRDWLTVTPYAGVSATDRHETRYQYGVVPEFALFDRPAYAPGAAVNPYLGLNVVLMLAPNAGIRGRFEIKSLATAIRNSPLVEDNKKSKVQLMVFYRY
jgi:outer membrane scaffolding protein for murein synthesis (MipA/OmpV family)